MIGHSFSNKREQEPPRGNLDLPFVEASACPGEKPPYLVEVIGQEAADQMGHLVAELPAHAKEED